MRREALALAAALALGLGGCVHALVGGDEGAPGARAPAPGAFVVRGGADGAPPARAVDPLAVLERRLLARGASEVLRTDEATPDRAQLELFLVGSRLTPLSRWTGFPLALATLATLGLVPHREAHEHFVELHAVLPQAPPGRRIRIARRSYVHVAWTWLPLAFVRAGSTPADERRVHEEGLARAIDAALDEVLAPDVPGPLAARAAAARAAAAP